MQNLEEIQVSHGYGLSAEYLCCRRPHRLMVRL